MDFASLYFISANANRSSICAIGVTIVNNNNIVRSLSYKVKPIPLFFDGYNIEKYSLVPNNYQDALLFPQVWENITKEIGSLDIVTFFTPYQKSLFRESLLANNITDFDDIKPYCSWRLAKGFDPQFFSHRISTISRKLKIRIDLGIPESVSEAISNITLHYAKEKNATTLSELYSLVPKQAGIGGVGRKSIFEDNISINGGDLIKGNIFCFTGEMAFCKREDAKKIVTESGGEASDGVTSKTTFLVIGDKAYTNEEGKPSSKVQKAQKMLQEGKDISIISEEEFLQMVTINK